MRREQPAAIAALVAIVVLAWLALLAMPAHGATHGWSAHYFGAMLVMWPLMMAAMMLPSAGRPRRRPRARRLGPSGAR